MTSGQLLREARLRAGLTQSDLAERVRMPRSQIARWEAASVEPGLATLRAVIRACGFEISLALQPFAPQPEREARLAELGRLTPHERLEQMLTQRQRQ